MLDSLKRLIHLAHDASTGSADAQIALLRETVSGQIPADAVAGTDYDNYVWQAPRAGIIKSVALVPQGTLTAHDDNYSTVSICSGAAAAATVTVLASVTTKITGGTGDWAVGIPEAIAVDDTDVFAAGEQLLIRSAKAGTGVAVPLCCVAIEVEYT